MIEFAITQAVSMRKASIRIRTSNQVCGISRQILSQLNPENLGVGFKASGVFPLDRQGCLKRVPDVNKGIGNETVRGL